MSFRVQFSHDVLCARQARNWTQPYVADSISITLRQYQNIESGRCTPRTDTISLDWILKNTRKDLFFMYLYLLTESEFVLPDTGLCRCFGLRVVRVQKGRVEELLLLPDISADRSFVMHLAQLFTRLQPAPVHLRDILQDML